MFMGIIGALAAYQKLFGDVDFDFGHWGSPAATVAHGTPRSFVGRVTKVKDGDTFDLSCCDRPIRLWGIDAPEWNEQGGSAATSALKRLIAGESLNCVRRDVDRYGRLVGQCSLPDGRDLGQALLETGTVGEYCYFSGGYYGRC
jgi:endonuclease YncB( thermonuclease family)